MNEELDSLLSKYYYDVGGPASYASVEKLYHIVNAEGKKVGRYKIRRERELTGKIRRSRRGPKKTANLIRNRVDKLHHEELSRCPVETWLLKNGYIVCILYNFEHHPEFIEDLYFCGCYFDAVLADYKFMDPVNYQ
ncbi:Hypothetical predicted protein [Mytilus galloprovincialis]|uniref:Uncharacterized protein n=1 Tax=Mytilus galloprovincialis TaxID=29158 RepID=A0A8B6G7X3_MYTGA|nr:Hypothetical predicted protein [Mytilus galloprovincialis]